MIVAWWHVHISDLFFFLLSSANILVRTRLTSQLPVFFLSLSVSDLLFCGRYHLCTMLLLFLMPRCIHLSFMHCTLMSHCGAWSLASEFSMSFCLCSEPFTRTAHRLDGPGPFTRQDIECTVPLMLVRTLPVTGTCPYEPNRCYCYGYHALSGRSKLLPVGC